MSGSTSRAPLKGGGPKLSSSARSPWPAAADNTDPADPTDRHHTSSSFRNANSRPTSTGVGKAKVGAKRTSPGNSHSSHATGSSTRSQPAKRLGGRKPNHLSTSAAAVHSPSRQSDAEVGKGKEGAGGSLTVQPSSSTTSSARDSSSRSHRSNHAASTSPPTKVAKVSSA